MNETSDHPVTQELQRRSGKPLVRRDTTASLKALAKEQTYAPCPCGSGKKYKFCCRGRI